MKKKRIGVFLLALWASSMGSFGADAAEPTRAQIEKSWAYHYLVDKAESCVVTSFLTAECVVDIASPTSYEAPVKALKENCRSQGRKFRLRKRPQKDWYYKSFARPRNMVLAADTYTEKHGVTWKKARKSGEMGLGTYRCDSEGYAKWSATIGYAGLRSSDGEHIYQVDLWELIPLREDVGLSYRDLLAFDMDEAQLEGLYLSDPLASQFWANGKADSTNVTLIAAMQSMCNGRASRDADVPTRERYCKIVRFLNKQNTASVKQPNPRAFVHPDPLAQAWMNKDISAFKRALDAGGNPTLSYEYNGRHYRPIWHQILTYKIENIREEWEPLSREFRNRGYQLPAIASYKSIPALSGDDIRLLSEEGVTIQTAYLDAVAKSVKASIHQYRDKAYAVYESVPARDAKHFANKAGITPIFEPVRQSPQRGKWVCALGRPSYGVVVARVIDVDGDDIKLSIARGLPFFAQDQFTLPITIDGANLDAGTEIWAESHRWRPCGPAKS